MRSKIVPLVGAIFVALTTVTTQPAAAAFIPFELNYEVRSTGDGITDPASGAVYEFVDARARGTIAATLMQNASGQFMLELDPQSLAMEWHGVLPGGLRTLIASHVVDWEESGGVQPCTLVARLNGDFLSTETIDIDVVGSMIETYQVPVGGIRGTTTSGESPDTVSLSLTGRLVPAADWPLNGFEGVETRGIMVSGAGAVPEPSSMALLGIGIAGLFGYGWRRRRRSS